MSDDEFSTMVSRNGEGHKKGPRFSWTPAYEATFFRSLCESVSMGLKDNHSFKQEAWDRAMQALQERHGAYPNKGHLINKSDNARKKFRLWRGLREDPRFLYNPTTKTVNAPEEVWKQHIEKEPLSRSLRGRPFDHEEFYDILFPDVIGSGGAPKRITKPRRKGPDILPGVENEQDTPGTNIIHLLNDGGFGAMQQHPQNPAPMGSILPSSIPSNNTPLMSQQRPTQAALPNRGSIASTSALTPPDENVPHSRKRFLPQDAMVTGPNVVMDNSQTQTPNPNPAANKRRRTTATNNFVDLTHSAQGQLATTGNRDGVAMLAEALSRASQPAPRWSEQAMDIFFRDFADEDMDLQVKIAEKMLTDANKAAMFCKMPVNLRKHWVKRLREAHNRIGTVN